MLSREATDLLQAADEVRKAEFGQWLPVNPSIDYNKSANPPEMETAKRSLCKKRADVAKEHQEPAGGFQREYSLTIYARIRLSGGLTKQRAPVPLLLKTEKRQLLFIRAEKVCRSRTGFGTGAGSQVFFIGNGALCFPQEDKNGNVT